MQINTTFIVGLGGGGC